MHLSENEISRIVVNKAFEIHKELGPGLFESVYEHILIDELRREGLSANAQETVPVYWKGKEIDQGFRADIIINAKVIVELKSVEKISPVHFKQLLTYLRLTNMKLGLLMNFNESLLKNGIHRVVNNL